MQVTTNGVTVHHHHDPLNKTGYTKPIEEKATPAGTPTRSYLFGKDVIAQKDVDSEEYLVADGRGVTRAVTDGAGVVGERYDFDAFGNAHGFTAGLALTTHLADDGTYTAALGKHWHGGSTSGRYSDRGTGTWLTKDAFFGWAGDPLSQHSYVFVHHNPANGTDPTGMFSLPGMVVTAGITGLVSSMLTGAYMYAKGYAYGVIADAMWKSFLVGAAFGAVGFAAFAGAGAVGAATAGSAAVGHAALAIIATGVSMPLAIANFARAIQNGDTVDQVFAAVDLALAGGGYFLVRYAAARPGWLVPAAVPPRSQVEEVGNGVLNYLGPGFTIDRATERAFVAISADRQRMFRVDIQGHGFRPHAHLQVWDAARQRFVDAPGTPHHISMKLTNKRILWHCRQSWT